MTVVVALVEKELIFQYTILALSIASAVGSVACLILSWLSYVKAAASLKIASAVSDRLDRLDESVVRSVMEEEKQVESEEVLQIFERLRNKGMLADDALREAKLLCKK